MKVWIDGQLLDREQAKISVFDHCVLYGDGVFEGIRLYNGCIYRLKQHLDRLWQSAHFISLKIPISAAEMTAALIDTIKANGLSNGYIRIVVTRGDGDLGLNPSLCPRATVFIIAANISLYPESDYENGLEVVCTSTNRSSIASWNGRVKSCNYLNNIMGKIEGQLAGCREALMLDSNGFIVEATADNVFVVKDNVLTTPPVYLGALRGITRDAIIGLAEAAGLRVKEEPFTRFEVYTADEMFLTGTAAEAIPVTKVDGRVIGSGKPGPVTQRLIGQFRQSVSSDGVMVN